MLFIPFASKQHPLFDGIDFPCAFNDLIDPYEAVIRVPCEFLMIVALKILHDVFFLFCADDALEAGEIDGYLAEILGELDGGLQADDLRHLLVLPGQFL